MTKVRFAPSPTGHLHVGNARVALANFLFARRLGGTFVLRIDDTDAERCRPEFVAAIEHDLRWLGIGWDDSFRQSTRLDRYAAAAKRLEASGRLYPCFEGEDELRFKREMRIKRGQAPIYDRAMLRLTPAQRAAAEAGGKRPYWRFKLTDTTVAWVDMVRGASHVKLTAVSDPVLIGADGTPQHAFTSVVDDIETGTTHIIQGEDHLTNSGVQIDLFSALGVNPTRLSFGHVPMLSGGEAGKPVRRRENPTLRGLRGDGVEPAAIVAYLARLGSADAPVPLAMEQLAAGFDLSHFTDTAARFDAADLLAVNRAVLRAAPFAAVADRLPAGATEAFWLAVRGHLDLLNEARGWWDVVAGDIVPPAMAHEAALLRAAQEALPPEPWDDATWPAWVDALAVATGQPGEDVRATLALALTGEEQGPDLRDLLPLIGRARAAERLRLSALG
jgi:glutamyl-tRNA synthetase